MRLDVLLSLILFLVSLITLFLYDKYEVKVKSLFGENKFRTRDAVLIVLMMGTMVTVIAFIPQLALMLLILFAYALLLFLFTYVISQISSQYSLLSQFPFFWGDCSRGNQLSLLSHY